MNNLHLIIYLELWLAEMLKADLSFTPPNLFFDCAKNRTHFKVARGLIFRCDYPVIYPQIKGF